MSRLTDRLNNFGRSIWLTLFGVAINFLLAIPLLFLWNWIVVGWGAPPLTYLQSWGLLVIVQLLSQNDFGR